MSYSFYSSPRLSGSMQANFSGLNKNSLIGDGEFADMKNMSGDAYPLLSPRKKRKVAERQRTADTTETVTAEDGSVSEVVTTEGQRLCGILGDVGFAAVWGSDFYYLGQKVEGITLTTSDKSLVAMGGYILVFPDAVYYNTVTGESGTLDENDKRINANSIFSGFYVESFTFDLDGEEKTWSKNLSVELPCDFTYNGVHYDSLGTGSNNETEFFGSSLRSEFEVDAAFSDALFVAFDGEALHYSYKGTVGGKGSRRSVKIEEWRRLDVKRVTLEINSAADNTSSLKEGAKNIWSGGRYVGYTYENGSITVEINGTLGDYFSKFAAVSSMQVPTYLQAQFIWQVRTIPILDFVCVHENRIWGCHYGFSLYGDKSVNEIYCSALGDFHTWTTSGEVATLAGSPYTLSVGDYGEFTGCISHRGYVLFFKEDVIYRISGTKPANFRVAKIAAAGVQKGSERSMQIIDEVLFYKAKNGVYAYDGSLPEKVSRALGERLYTDAVAGSFLSRYYISMVSGGERMLYVFDTSTGLWHAEDSVEVRFFTEYGGALYGAVGNDIICFCGEVSEIFATPESEGDFEWYCESGDKGLSSPYQKYFHRLLVRMEAESGARLKVSLACDGGEFTLAGDYTASGKRTVLLPIVTPRCDHMRIRLDGKGYVKVYSIYYETETASEICK